LALDLCVFNFVFELVWQVHGSKLEKDHLMVGLFVDVFDQVMLHFFLNGGSQGEKVVGSVKSGSVRDGIQNHTVENGLLVFSVSSVDVINLGFVDFVLERDLEV
jgi:hypothetical protein